jgi:hypothetical protein
MADKPISRSIRIHKTLRTSSAMAAGIDPAWSMKDVVALIDAQSAKVSGDTLAGRTVSSL